MTVEVILKKDFIKEGPTWLNGAFICNVQNVARVSMQNDCTFFYDVKGNLIVGFGSRIEHNFVEKEIIPLSICLKCGEPLTSDDFKLRDAGSIGMHLHCLDEANEELQYRVSSKRIPEDEK